MEPFNLSTGRGHALPFVAVVVVFSLWVNFFPEVWRRRLFHSCGTDPT